MKNILVVAGVIALAACSGQSEAPMAEETAALDVVETSPDLAAAMDSDGKPMTGKFEVVSGDGSIEIIQTINPDGSVESVTGGETVNGTWTVDEAGKFCITNEGEMDASCYNSTLNEDGTMLSTNVSKPNDTWKIKRIG